ncbi:UTRA domain-containing protein [Agrobacterium vitis]|uniref:UTRA domain-containing protein n=1 Tax=Agrobacterium vitis TaxID=373 RepID=UPI0012E7D8EC|nr:UTRA domain-containing protein [Agrobacterium vitis]
MHPLELRNERRTHAEAEVLALPSNSDVHKFERLRRLDGFHYARPDRFRRKNRIGYPSDRGYSEKTLVLQFLERYGVRASSIRERVSAELANDEDAAAFARPCPSPSWSSRK